MVSVAYNLPNTATSSSPGSVSDLVSSGSSVKSGGKSAGVKSQKSSKTLPSDMTVELQATDQHQQQHLANPVDTRTNLLSPIYNNSNSNNSGSSNSNVSNSSNSGGTGASSSTGSNNDRLAEGMLCKYTNVVNGWKNRWFVLNKDVLEYYEKEDHKFNLQKPRGTLSIFGATVIPSEDDSLTFVVTTPSGNILKLKASDQKERTFWIHRLRQASAPSSQSQSSILSSVNLSKVGIIGTVLDSPVIPPRRGNINNSSSSNEPMSGQVKVDAESTQNPASGANLLVPNLQAEQRILSAVNQAQNSYAATCRIRDRLRESIERIPSRTIAFDANLLQLKANATAVCVALEQCIGAVRKQSGASTAAVSTKTVNGKSGELTAQATGLLDVSPRVRQTTSQKSSSSNLLAIVPSLPIIDHDKAVEDTERYHETGIGNVEPQRPAILQMLAELKLGMDLTRVSLPTFILEKRSLLEMFADCMSHPDMFLKIADLNTPEARMRQVLLWYLTSIHAGRQGDISKKPYNPLIGETFHCCWNVGNSRITYTAEQVSHHPPVSAFYFECPNKSMTLSGSIWTKSQYLGMSIGAQMIGQITLTLLGRNERYVMTLPSAYARSILSFPWVELGDRCTIHCPETNYCASVVFHTKTYGGTLHRISGEVQSPKSSTPCVKFSGEWTGRIDFSVPGDNFSIDVSQLKLTSKRVRPLSLQSEWESRRLWQSVTQALKKKDIEGATANKKMLEEQQRQEERNRRDKGVVYESKYFVRTAGSNESVWSYKTPLTSSSNERQSLPSQ